jgi:hypothetical protein
MKSIQTAISVILTLTLTSSLSSVFSGCNYLQSSNLESGQLAVSGNAVFMFPIINITGTNPYSSCSSDIILTAEVLTHNTEVASYAWQYLDSDPIAPSFTLPLQTSCSTVVFDGIYSGPSSRISNTDSLEIKGIQPMNSFMIMLTVTDKKGRTASAISLITSTRIDKNNNSMDFQTETLITRASPNIVINGNTITFSATSKSQFSQESTNGDSNTDVSTYVGHMADWNNDDTFNSGVVDYTQSLSHTYLTYGDHSAKYNSASPVYTDANAIFQMLATKYIFITSNP